MLAFLHKDISVVVSVVVVLMAVFVFASVVFFETRGDKKIGEGELDNFDEQNLQKIEEHESLVRTMVRLRAAGELDD